MTVSEAVSLRRIYGCGDWAWAANGGGAAASATTGGQCADAAIKRKTNDFMTFPPSQVQALFWNADGRMLA